MLFENKKQFIMELVRRDGYNLQFAENFRSNLKIVLNAVANNGDAIQFATEDLQKNEIVILNALKQTVNAFKYIPDYLLNDCTFMLKAIKYNKNILPYISSKLKENNDFILAAITYNIDASEYLSNELKNDAVFITKFVRKVPSILNYISEELMTNKYFIYEIININMKAIRYIPKNVIIETGLIHSMPLLFFHAGKRKHFNYVYKYILHNFNLNKDTILSILKKSPFIYELLSSELKKDEDIILTYLHTNAIDSLPYISNIILSQCNKEFALLAVEQKCSTILLHISKEFQLDKEVVLHSVRLDGYTLKDAHEKFKDDSEVVIEAIKSYPFAINFASKNLIFDKKFNLEIVSINGECFRYINNTFRHDEAIILAAIQSYGFALEYASIEIQSNKQSVLQAVKSNGASLTFASEELKNDRDVVLCAVKSYGNALYEASPQLQQDKKIILATLINNVHHLDYTFLESQTDREIILVAIQNSGLALECVPEIFREDPDIVFKACLQNYDAFEFASKKLHSDKEFVLKLIEYNGDVIYYASYELLFDEDIIVAAIHNGCSLATIEEICNRKIIEKNVSIEWIKKVLIAKIKYLLKDAIFNEILEDIKYKSQYYFQMCGFKLINCIYSTNLRFSMFNGAVVSITSILNQLNNLWTITMYLMSGSEYLVYDISESATFNELSISCNKIYKINNIVFEINKVVIDLSQFNYKVIKTFELYNFIIK